MNLRRILFNAARELLRRHPSRRGPYLISDAELRRFLKRALSKEERA